ncbi:DNA replication protein, putative [Paecilomyces variotii No. 5]|uniref:DNA replication protein, putative n=1 Tax=Byssochlamys spectabilis (strain No. 5 / NBRC 109023) TaxID=1356009 RepID=V5G3W9_BYSSN|nr:DNA replication protein, putative [Paecilomyces variotii No. 5]
MQSNRITSPLKRSSTTPNLQAKSHRLLQESIGEEDEDEEDDEETLKLKLAAIEARLRLKKLQKQAKTGRSSSDLEGEEPPSRPSPAISASRWLQRDVHGTDPGDEIQVPLSPTRKAAPPVEPESPRRFLLGIDKGMRGKDVSLRRPPNSRVSNRPESAYGAREGAGSRSAYLSSTASAPSPFREPPRPKSFSERIAESRSAEKDRRERAEQFQKARSSAFQFDKEEMERFKAAAAEAKPASRSPTRSRPVESFSREDVLRSLNQSTSTRPRSHTMPSMHANDLTRPSSSSRETAQSFHERPRSQGRSDSPGARGQSHVPGEADEDKSTLTRAGDPSKYEAFSSLHLSSRILPHSFLSRTLEDKKIITIPQLLKMVKAPDFELDVDGDYVVFGIVASKSDPRERKESKNVAKEADPFDEGLNNTNKYMAMTLTDLKWSVDLFLFDTAFPRYYKLSEGILIAVLNPTIMPPPPNKIDTNRFSLAISSSDDTILEIGYAQDIGFCKAVRKDGKTCHSWVDARKTEFCDFHIDVQIRRTQAQRMGVNNGTGMFGPGGRSGPRTGFFGGEKRGPYKNNGLKPEGAQYDFGTQSTFYVARAPRMNNNYDHSFDHTNPFKRGQSAASLIDADDPFLAAGMAGRGKDNKAERLRRRLVEQQNERNIKKLVTSGAATGIGGEYLRARVSENRPSSSSRSDSSTPASIMSRDDKGVTPASSDFNLSGLRAQDVRLGPKKRAHDGDKPSNVVKKTRFITPKGIREAGRDSLRGTSELNSLAKTSNNDDYDDDDELDII